MGPHLSRPFFALLVYSLPILVVAFAVLMGARTLADATGDSTGSGVLRWIAIGCLILLVTDIILLVGTLGVRELNKEQEDTQNREP